MEAFDVLILGGSLLAICIICFVMAWRLEKLEKRVRDLEVAAGGE